MFIRRPIVVIACCWIIGIYFAHTMQLVHTLVAYVGLCCLLLFLFVHKQVTLGLMCTYVIVLGVSLVAFTIYDREQTTVLLPDAYSSSDMGSKSSTTSAPAGSAIGIIARTPERDGDRVQFELLVQAWLAPDGSMMYEQVSERVLVQVKLQEEQEIEQFLMWSKGQRIQVTGELAKPQLANHFGGFNYREYLRTKHIYWQLTVKGASAVVVTQPVLSDWKLSEIPNRISIRLEDVRQGSGELYRQLFSEKESAYLEGLVLGLRSELDPEMEDDFARLGLTHVLAISGLHVAVFVGACLLILRPFRLTNETSLLIVIFLIPIYVLFTGASPSVIRAGMMSMLALIGLRKGWLKDGLHLLAAALLLMLWWEPYYALDVSFQLSFAVTAGLIVGVPPMVRMLPFHWPIWLRSSIAVNVVAQLVSFPLTIYYFNQVSFLSLATNFVLVPFISFIVLPLGSIVLLVSLLSISTAKPIAWLISRSNEWTFAAVDWLASLEGTISIWPRVPIWWLLGYYGLLGVCLHIQERWNREQDRRRLALANEDTVPLDSFIQVPVGMKRRWRFLMSIPVGLLCVLLYVGYHYGEPSETSVYMLDVGQGDSMLIRTASGRNILIDGGGTVAFIKPGEEWRQRRKPYEVGASRIVPLLKQRGVRRLDAVVLSHGDHDHAGGLRAVLSEIPTDRFMMNGTWKSSPALKELYGIAMDKRIPIMSWSAGDYWQVDEDTRIDVLAPLLVSPEKLEEHEEQNEASLVLLLTAQADRSTANSQRSVSMLFTGDMGVAQEEAIMQKEQEVELGQGHGSNQANNSQLSLWPERIDLLKVAHHGSKTSSSEAWLNRLKPSASVISAGRGNRYGHPNIAVLERLRKAGSAIYRTDEQGELQFRVTSSGLKVRVKHDSIAQ